MYGTRRYGLSIDFCDEKFDEPRWSQFLPQNRKEIWLRWNGRSSASLTRAPHQVTHETGIGAVSQSDLDTLSDGSAYILAFGHRHFGKQFIFLDRKSTRLNSSH